MGTTRVLCACLGLLPALPALAQPAGGEARPAAHNDAMAALARAVQNPVADLVSLPREWQVRLQLALLFPK
jgi:hypothetical protein